MKCETIHLKEYYSFLGKDGCDATLDVYRPFNMDEMQREHQKRPCMLICPGGGYSFCSQREAEPIGLHFFPEGYNVFILYYSVDPHRFPQQLREVAASVELIYRFADEWNCDTDKIAIMGFSAGGHLAAHYSVAYDCAGVREVFPESKPVNATVLGYPVISAEKQENTHVGSFENLIGHWPESEEEKNQFSCERMVSDHTPPAFLWHTAEDACVPVYNSLVYAQALAAHKIPFELHVYPAGAHGLATADSTTNGDLPPEVLHAGDWLPAVKKWLSLFFAG